MHCQQLDPIANLIPTYGADLLPSYSEQATYNDLGAAATAPMSGEDMLRMSVPGNPGEDYPIYAEVPETAFLCDGQVGCSFTATFGRVLIKVPKKKFALSSFCRWTGVTTQTLRPSAKLSTCARPMATVDLPNTASSAPMAPCSTRQTLSASTGSTSTAPRPSPSTVSTTRSGWPRALEVLTALPRPHLEDTPHLRPQQPQHLDTQQLPQTILLQLQKTTLPLQLRPQRAMRRRLTMAMEPPSRTLWQATEEERRGEQEENREIVEAEGVELVSRLELGRPTRQVAGLLEAED